MVVLLLLIFNPWYRQSPFSVWKVIWLFLSVLMLAQHAWEVHKESCADSVFSSEFTGVLPLLSSPEWPQALLRLVLYL